MGAGKKILSNPFSTGGGGGHFEAHVQASFVALMLTGGYAPCLPNRPIRKIKLQGKYKGYETDDLIVFVQDNSGAGHSRLLAQVKHRISITKSNSTFAEVIEAAWNDFNNADVFTKNKDAIALITGPLSATDIHDVRSILDWSRHAENSTEFFEKVELSQFSSAAKRMKLQVFQTNIVKANGGAEVPDDEIFEFLRHYNLLGYDLDIKTGVILALIHSLIGQYSPDDVQSIWARLVDEVQSANKNAGTISVESLPKDLLSAFKQRRVETIPNELVVPSSPRIPRTWDNNSQAAALSITALIGKWYELSKPDIQIIKRLIEDYSSWIVSLREILQEQDNPLVLKNGHWAVEDRLSLWDAIGSRIFDDNLDSFKDCVVEVLSEVDPQFELPKEERYAASIHGKVLKHSHDLRKGLSDTLALLGNYSSVLVNCSQHKPESTVVIAIRKILDGASWQLWGSLHNLLPTLAEAAPDEFLNTVENALRQKPCPFDQLFRQEGDGTSGWNYMSGLQWALEGLAWSEQHIVRVAVILAELAFRDPGGIFSNRPSSSLTTILLPWYPQTLASIEKRISSIKAIRQDFPSVAWELLLSLLPNQHQTTSGSHKPRWRWFVSEDWEPSLKTNEYWDQAFEYAALAVEMAMEDLGRLTDLISNLDNLPPPSFDKALEYLASQEIAELPEEKRLPLWSHLTDFARKHRRFSDAKWALSAEIVSKIETTADKLSPISPEGLYSKLFSKRDHDLYEEVGNYVEQRKKLNERRRQAIQVILDANGLQSAIDFVEKIEAPDKVGEALARIANSEIDKSLIPAYLVTDNNKYQLFMGGYVWHRYQLLGLDWVDGLDHRNWSVDQNTQFLMYLPFEVDTWCRVEKWLGDKENEYWQKVHVDPFQSDKDLLSIVDKLIEVKRPRAAIDCLHYRLYMKWPLDINRTIRALLEAVSSNEPQNTIDAYDIAELIKALQDDPNTNPDDLFKVEWIYLRMLDRHSDTKPKLLETRLSTQPDFFCEIIRLIFRSSREKESRRHPSKQREALAGQAWRLLHEWKMLPGLKDDGRFSIQDFYRWLENVKTQCQQTGHLEVAMIKVGEVLFYSPADPSGLWIIQAIAEALNARDAEEMRQGFRTEAFNYRGVHWVDPTGKPERELAAKWREKADAIENLGYARFAATLKGLAESYYREAERVIKDHDPEVSD